MKIKSRKPSKQRRALYHIKNHQVSSIFTVPLSKDLQEEWGLKRVPVRVGDTVRIVKGEFSDIEGKVLSRNKKKRTLIIEECSREKRDGSEYFVPISVYNVEITKFGEKKENAKDPKRIEKFLKRKEQSIAMAEED